MQSWNWYRQCLDLEDNMVPPSAQACLLLIWLSFQAQHHHHHTTPHLSGSLGEACHGKSESFLYTAQLFK